MKIAKIETIRLPAHPNLIWVQIHTSDGLVGVGETYYIPAAVEAVIHDFAAPLLLGKSAFDRELHWQNLFACANFFGFAGAEMRAISALDLALWDLLGQHLRQPVPEDDGVVLSDLSISDDGSTVTFLRGGAPNTRGWIAVPRKSPSDENAAAPNTVISSTSPT